MILCIFYSSKKFLLFFFFNLAYLVEIFNSVIAGKCQYHNQTFSVNQSLVTSNCMERCQCQHVNGTAVAKCKPLCPIQEDPDCHQHSEIIKEFKIPLKDTNCTCTKKRCVSGKVWKLCNIIFVKKMFHVCR